MNVLVVTLDAETPVDVPESQVLVVAPALNSRLRRWLSDEDEARRLAGERANATVERLERSGLHARAQVGDGDPLQAIADALPVFPADEIVIAGDRTVFEILAERARARFGLPVFRRGDVLPHAA
jgi:nucleotide-binding universal stress UspA family protein